MLGLRVAPGIQVLHDQQAQDHLDRGGWPTGFGRMWPTSAQISLDLLEDLVVFEQLVQFGQLGFEAQLERGDQGEQVDWLGPIS